MKKILKKMLSFTLTAIVAAACLVFVGCKKETKEQEETVSTLRGTFTYNETVITRFKKEIQDGDWLYCSLYPQRDMVVDQEIAYRIDQRLKLNRDYTYLYEYTVILGSPGDWGNLEVAKLAVGITGTFTYKEKPFSENEYVVKLSNPTGGTEEIYGSNLNNSPAILRNWSLHAAADYQLDFSRITDFNSFVYDEYVCARTVSVKKAKDENESNELNDDVFYSYILNDFGRFSTY
jgi:hypothetical protein